MAPPRGRDIYSWRDLFLSLLFIYFFLGKFHKIQPSADLNAECIKRRPLLQGRAFWGCEWIQLALRGFPHPPKFPRPPLNRDLPAKHRNWKNEKNGWRFSKGCNAPEKLHLGPGFRISHYILHMAPPSGEIGKIGFTPLPNCTKLLISRKRR